MLKYIEAALNGYPGCRGPFSFKSEPACVLDVEIVSFVILAARAFARVPFHGHG